MVVQLSEFSPDLDGVRGVSQFIKIVQGKLPCKAGCDGVAGPVVGIAQMVDG
jgi:hypothetical protein